MVLLFKRVCCVLAAVFLLAACVLPASAAVGSYLYFDLAGGTWPDGSDAAPEFGMEGEYISGIHVPVRDGYVFSGWVHSGGGEYDAHDNEFTFGSTAGTLTATWTSVAGSVYSTTVTIAGQAFSFPGTTSSSPDVTLQVTSTGATLSAGSVSQSWTYSGSGTFAGFSFNLGGEPDVAVGASTVFSGSSCKDTSFALYVCSGSGASSGGTSSPGSTYAGDLLYSPIPWKSFLVSPDSPDSLRTVTPVPICINTLVPGDSSWSTDYFAHNIYVAANGVSSELYLSDHLGGLSLVLHADDFVLPRQRPGEYWLTFGRDQDAACVYQVSFDWAVFTNEGSFYSCVPGSFTTVSTPSTSGVDLYEIIYPYITSRYPSASYYMISNLTVTFSDINGGDKDWIDWTNVMNFEFTPLSDAQHRLYDVTSWADSLQLPISTVNEIVYTPSNPDGVNFVDWLQAAVGSFLDFEIWPGMSINTVLWFVVTVGLLLWFLKLLS